MPLTAVFPAPGGPARTGSSGARGADHLEGRFWAGALDVCRPLTPSASWAANPILPRCPAGWQLRLCLLPHSGCLGDEFQEAMCPDLELGGTKWNR